MRSGRLSLGRRGGVLPPPASGDASQLAALVALLTFVLALTVVAARIADSLAANWQAALTGVASIVLPPEADGAAAARALGTVRGVASATVLDGDRIDALLAPWLGGARLPPDVALPVIVAVEWQAGAVEDPAALRSALDPSLAETAQIETHQGWRAEIAATLAGLRAGLIVLAAGLVLAVVIAVGLASSARLQIQGRQIELLHLLGADNASIAAQMQEDALRLSLLGGAVGAVAAALVLVLIQVAVPTEAGLPRLSLSWWDAALLLALPVVTALVATLTARLVTLRRLAGLA